MMSFERARENMVEGQIRPNKVTDTAVLDAFSAVPREVFVPKNLQGVAYADEEIVAGQGSRLMKPMVLARLVQAAGVRSSDVVLNLGCRTGYSSAILARLAATVIAFEPEAALAGETEAQLRGLDVCNAVVVHGKLEGGYPKQAPYDVIFIGGAVPAVTPGIFDQLAEGGRLVAVIGPARPRALGMATLYTRRGDKITGTPLFDAGASFLPGFGTVTEAFSF